MSSRVLMLGLPIGLVCLVGLAGCRGSSVEPTPDYRVDLEIRLSDVVVDGVVVEVQAVATARNTGALPVTYVGGCPPVPAFSMFTSEGSSIRLRSACDPLPGCPAIRGSLDPGESVTQTLTFDGTTWNECDRQSASPGIYEIVGTFYYSTTDLGKEIRLTASKSFDWNSPPPLLQTEE